MNKPTHPSKKDAKFFAELLLTEALTSIEKGAFTKSLSKGATDSIQYNRDTRNFLENEQEYRTDLPEGELQLSVQLYENQSGHYRLYCFTKINGIQGMTFSLNLTTAKAGTKIPLRQKIKFTEQHPELTPQEAKELRKKKQEDFSALLLKLGYKVDGYDLSLGTLDCHKGGLKFVESNQNKFLNDFLVVSILKGHFQGNKGYRLTAIDKL